MQELNVDLPGVYRDAWVTATAMADQVLQCSLTVDASSCMHSCSRARPYLRDVYMRCAEFDRSQMTSGVTQDGVSARSGTQVHHC